MQAAARLDDPIAHSSAESGLITGMLAGAILVLSAIAIVGTGGAALPFLIGAVLTGAAVGGWIGEYFGSLSLFDQVAGRVASGSPDVFANYKPLARALDDIGECTKHGPEPQQIVMGSETVFINCRPAVRVKDKLQCSGFIMEGSPDVFIGGGQAQYTDKPLDDEVGWQYRALEFGAGVAGALLLGGLAAIPAIVGGFAGGYVGGEAMGLVGRYYGDWLSEKIGGTPEDWEKTGKFVGQAIGGWLGAKGGPKAWEVVKRIEVEQGTLGANGGNIRIRKAAGEGGIISGSFAGKSPRQILKAAPKTWKKGPVDRGHGWKLIDENGIERVRYMYPTKEKIPKFERMKVGYWRRQDAKGNYLDEAGNVVPKTDPMFEEKTHFGNTGVDE